MATRIFLDTNIFLDLLDNQRQCHKEAVLLFELIDNGEVMAFFFRKCSYHDGLSFTKITFKRFKD